MRSLLTTVSEGVGMALASAGCWLIWHPIGLIVAGIGLIAVGVTQA